MEKSLFVEFFGDAPLVRVLDFLLENKIFDYTKTEIAKGAEISRVSLYKVWPSLIDHKIVTKTRVMGKTVLFKLNEKSPIAQELLSLDLRLSKEYVEKEAEKHKVVARAKI